MSTKEHLITKVSEITFCPFCLMLIMWCSGIATSSCSSNIEGKGKVGKGSGTLLPPTLLVRQGNLLCILALVESLRKCFCVDAGCDTSVQIILGKKSNRRFRIEDASKTWPRIKLPPCSRPLRSWTSGPSAGLVSGLPRSHFVKQLLGVVDVVGCSGCRSAGPSAMRGGRSHRDVGSYRALTWRRS